MSMRKVIFAAVATAALCVPALAQQGGKTPAQPGSGASQTLNQSGNQQVSPHQLSASQVREIQQSLDNEGFKSGKVDGRWGAETEAALKDFQKSQNMPGTGELDSSTIGKLGLNTADFGLAKSGSETTGQAPRSNSRGSKMDHNAPAQNGGNQNVR
jgi:peptidoglycan hydrolase-like protein with peptidoglycan-binding domain